MASRNIFGDRLSMMCSMVMIVCVGTLIGLLILGKSCSIVHYLLHCVGSTLPSLDGGDRFLVDVLSYHDVDAMMSEGFLIVCRPDAQMLGEGFILSGFLVPLKSFNTAEHTNCQAVPSI